MQQAINELIDVCVQSHGNVSEVEQLQRFCSVEQQNLPKHALNEAATENKDRSKSMTIQKLFAGRYNSKWSKQHICGYDYCYVLELAAMPSSCVPPENLSGPTTAWVWFTKHRSIGMLIRCKKKNEEIQIEIPLKFMTSSEVLEASHDMVMKHKVKTSICKYAVENWKLDESGPTAVMIASSRDVILTMQKSDFRRIAGAKTEPTGPLPIAEDAEDRLCFSLICYIILIWILDINIYNQQ